MSMGISFRRLQGRASYVESTETSCGNSANGYSGHVEARNGMKGKDGKACRTDASHKLVHMRPRSARHEGMAWGENAEVVAIAESSGCRRKVSTRGSLVSCRDVVREFWVV